MGRRGGVLQAPVLVLCVSVTKQGMMSLVEWLLSRKLATSSKPLGGGGAMLHKVNSYLSMSVGLLPSCLRTWCLQFGRPPLYTILFLPSFEFQRLEKYILIGPVTLWEIEPQIVVPTLNTIQI